MAVAENFTKKQALALLKEVGDKKTSSTSEFLLGDEQKNTIMTFYKDRSYAAAYGAGLPVKEIGEGSVTYTLNAGALVSEDKKTLGDGISGAGATEAAKQGFRQRTVYLSTPKKIGDGFYKSDLMMGMENAVAIKYAAALNSFDKEFERGFLKTVASKTTGAEIEIDAIDTADKAKAAKTQLVDKAFEVAEIENEAWALDGIDESRIFIDLSSKLFNRLADERLIVDAADAQFQNGIFRIGQMGGFTVRRNEFLGKPGIIDTASKVVHAIIATDVTAASPRKLVAANAGKLAGLSEDEGYYVEQKFASVDGASVDYAVMGVEPLIASFVAKP